MIDNKVNKVRTGEYYITPQGEPEFNMEFDNWLYQTVQEDKNCGSVILRLYSWSRPAITVGYNQDLNKVINWQILDNTIPVIRRITGGRAIYHDQSEITFSLTANLEIFPEAMRSISKTNQLISEAVVEVLAESGVISEWMSSSDPSFGRPTGKMAKSCFNSFSRFEIFSEGYKIVAGAQRRKGRFFIHQGSIKLNGISDCPAIGQKGTRLNNTIMETNSNSYKYTIDALSHNFLKVFPSKFGFEFLQIGDMAKFYSRIPESFEK